MASMINNFTEAQLQSNQISSTVLDSPYTYDYNTGSYVDSRHNYYNHPAAAGHHTPHHQPPPATNGPAPHHPQWPDFNNNSNSGNTNSGSTGSSGSAPAFDPTGTNLQLGLKPRGGVEENPDSTSLANSQQALFNNGFAGSDASKASASDLDYFKATKPEYQVQSHQTSNQSSYSMYPPPPPPHHHHHQHHHHHPGFGEHQAYQQNYDYRYNYAPYANQAFHHPYSGMYSTPAYSGAHGWNSMYSPSPAANPSSVLPPSAHIPVSGGSGPGAPFGYNHQMLPLNASAATVASTVIKSEPVPKVEPIGEVQEVNDNLEAFQDSQMGGIGIALGHGSVLFECAKHEMHATSALRRPNRTHPNRIALIFYQHRNLNRPKHGTEEWEKMRQKKNNQEVENKLLKSIKQEGEVPEEPPTPAGGSASAAGKKGAKVGKVEQNSTTAASEYDMKPEVASLHSSPQLPLPPQLTAPLPVAPTWPGNFAMGYPMHSPYHPHANSQFHHQYQAAAHHHMMGPIAKSSSSKSLST